jgi:hypothetical protein
MFWTIFFAVIFAFIVIKIFPFVLAFVVGIFIKIKEGIEDFFYDISHPVKQPEPPKGEQLNSKETFRVVLVWVFIVFLFVLYSVHNPSDNKDKNIFNKDSDKKEAWSYFHFLKDQNCEQSWPNSVFVKVDENTGQDLCDCDEGFRWNKDMTACIEL